MNNLRVYLCGKTYKYISIPLVNANNNINNDFRQNELIKNKNKCNIIRAKTKVRDLILCNNFKYFVTITINSNYDRNDLKHLQSIIGHRIRNYRKPGLDLSYVLIPERHKNGAWHLHGVLGGGFKQFIQVNEHCYHELKIFNSLGFNSISVIENDEAIAHYVTKYITKDFVSRDKTEHLYFCSRGLKRPQLLLSKFYENSFFDFQFFDYKSDFSYVKYDSKYYKFITNLL